VPLAADLSRNELWIGDWSRRATNILVEGGDWSAVVGLRNPAVLLLEWRDDEPVAVSLWAGPPKQSPGAAVVVGGRGIEGIRAVPVCECGDQGCADATFQLHGRFAAEHLPALIELLDGLTTTTVELGASNYWRPDRFEEVGPAEWPTPK
jgi:hypothetical protein